MAKMSDAQKIAALTATIEGQEKRLQEAAADFAAKTDELRVCRERLAAATAESKALVERAADTGAKSSDDFMARASAYLMELPNDSELKKAVYAFIDALIENYADGPGAPGRAAYAILTAASNQNDPAYAALTLLERTAAASMANALKGTFRAGK